MPARCGWRSASQQVSAPPIDSPTTATWSQRAASAWKWASAAPDQSSQRVGTMSSTAVPWPGSSGSSTVNPAAASASASGRMDWGFPVNP